MCEPDLYSRPSLLVDDVDERLDHLLADLVGLLGLPLLERLSDAEEHLDPLVEGGLGSGGDGLGGVLEERSSLRVSGQGVLDPGVDEHVGRDLSGKGSLGLGEAVLRRDVDVGLGLERGEVGSGGDEEEGRGSNDDLCEKEAVTGRATSQ